MKNDWICFVLGMLFFVSVQNVCLFTKTNLWLAQFLLARQQQIKQWIEVQQQKKVKTNSEEENTDGWNKQVHEFSKILLDLKTAEEQQQERQQQLDKLAEQLSNEREALNLLKQSIEILQKELERQIILIKDSEVKNFKTLAETYTNMTPEAVAKLFAELEESSVIKVMHFLAPDVLGPILQAMAQDLAKNKEKAPKINHLLETFRLSTKDFN